MGKLLAQPAEFRREVRDFFDVGDRVVTVLHQMGRPKGGHVEYDVTEVQIWTVRRGRIVNFEAWYDTSIVLRTLRLQPRA